MALPERLSEHFTLEELTFSETAARMGLDNRPTGLVLENLRATAQMMEKVRAVLGNRPITISSGYRATAVNKAVGGAKSSAHVQGYAVDFNCRTFGGPLRVAEALKDHLRYDQLIHEFGSWVHISFDPANRMEELTIDGKGTRAGLWVVR